jgi:hypothetical protein
VRELIHEYTTRIRNAGGTTYVVRVYAEERADRTWYAWLEFEPVDWRKPMLRTDQETSQPNREAVEYWAGGIEPVYLEGALARAHI